MNQFKELANLSSSLSDSLKASKNAQEEYQNKILDFLESILSDVDCIHDLLLITNKRLKLMDDDCPSHYSPDKIHCQMCEFKSECIREDED